jgi:hypothetical protein
MEILVLLGSAATGTGDALDNAIAGNAAANLRAWPAPTYWTEGGRVDGAAGADAMAGGAGDDIHMIDNAGDT